MMEKQNIFYIFLVFSEFCKMGIDLPIGSQPCAL